VTRQELESAAFEHGDLEAAFQFQRGETYPRTVMMGSFLAGALWMREEAAKEVMREEWPWQRQADFAKAIRAIGEDPPQAAKEAPGSTRTGQDGE
jgi:hypothetical protein